MLNSLAKLKSGKASGSSITAKHILHGSPQLSVHLHLLFNAMIQHGHVPYDFLKGTISPIAKDSEGDMSSLDNYRPITLSHIFSYLFEHAIVLKIDLYLKTDNLQFGYKKGHSTSHAIYAVKRCIEYFCEHKTSVYACFLDCSKGFDRVSHAGLFLKLLKRGVPLCWLRIFIYWYSNMFSVCKWNGALSYSFSVVSGVRQGGVLSAKFWALYMDDLVMILRSTGKGCHIMDTFIACILYADDVCLLAPSRSAIQLLLDLCNEYAESLCIKYNERKSKLMYFGRDHNSFHSSPILLNGVVLEFVSQWKYLGVILESGKNFSCSAKKARVAFYRSANSILRAMRGPSELVQMKLLYSICVPNMTYCCEVTDFPYREKESLSVALNDAIRRIFSYNRWESIRVLRASMGYLSVTEIFAKRKKTFLTRIPRLGNGLLSFISQLPQ